MEMQMSAVGILRSQEVKQAQLEARIAEDGQKKLLHRLRRQVAKARVVDQGALFPQSAADAPAKEYPMPRIGFWRCYRKASCQGCEMGTFRSDPNRQENGCKCHIRKRCKVWDDQGDCYTSYEEAPQTARVLTQIGEDEA